MHVTLINPPWYFTSGLEVTFSQNLALGYLAAYLRQYGGHEVTIIDALGLGIERRVPIVDRSPRYEREIKGALPRFLYDRFRDEPVMVGLSFDEISQLVPERTDLIGVTGPFTHLGNVVDDMVRYLKGRFPSKPVVLGGVYPSTNPERALRSGADYLITGEGEKALCDLLAGVPFDQVRGLRVASGATPIPGRDSAAPQVPTVPLAQLGTTKRDERLAFRPDRSLFIDELDAIPFPARDLLPMDKYVKRSPRNRQNLPTASLITSRGCPYDCTFCSIHPMVGYKWRYRSARNVLDEIELLYSRYGVRILEFEDDMLTTRKDRTLEIFRGLLEMNHNSSLPHYWTTPNGVRVDTLTKEIIQLFKDSGCVQLQLALEHGDPEMRERMEKRLDQADIEPVIRWCGEVGIPTAVFLIVGYPGETRQRFERGLDFCKKLRSLGVTHFNRFIAQPYPGTPLYADCKEKGYLRGGEIESDFDFNLFTSKNKVWIETEDFDAAEVRRRHAILGKELNPAPFRARTVIRRIVPRSLLQNIRLALRWA